MRHFFTSSLRGFHEKQTHIIVNGKKIFNTKTEGFFRGIPSLAIFWVMEIIPSIELKKIHRASPIHANQRHLKKMVPANYIVPEANVEVCLYFLQS